jgi:uncharacterized membrane protein YhaH (DUF805 family)
MLEYVFSFRGRINRLQYFLGVLGLATTLVILALVAFFALLGGRRPESLASVLLPAALFALVALPLFLWISLSLQARRLRDIGWNPIFVIPGVITFAVFDELIAMAVPALSISKLHHQTILGLLVSFGLGCCLLFWPGRDPNEVDLDDGASWPAPEPSELGSGPSPEPTAAPARPAAPAWNAAPVRTGFGRRGL